MEEASIPNPLISPPPNHPLFWGCLFAGLSVIGFTINSIVLYAIFKGRLLFKGKSSAAYIFSVSSIAMDNLMILIHAIYQVPAILSQSWFFEGANHATPVIFLSFVFIYCWYYTTLSHILISTTRPVATFSILYFRRGLHAVVHCNSSLLTNRRTVGLVVLVHVLSLGGAVFSQFLSPCCRLSFGFEVYSYLYETVPFTPNYSNYFEIPFTIFSTVCSFICYGAIAVYMEWLERWWPATSAVEALKLRHQDYVYAKQFAAMAVFYTISWLSIRLVPELAGNSKENICYYGITTLFVLLNAWSNAFVYLVNNKEVLSYDHHLEQKSASATLMFAQIHNALDIALFGPPRLDPVAALQASSTD